MSIEIAAQASSSEAARFGHGHFEYRVILARCP